jgi:predicted RNase H-like HicB family nuclease
MTEMTLNDYVSLPYDVEVVPDVCDTNLQCYVASHPELPGCMSHGATAEEAIANLRDARAMYIGSLLRRGLRVPPPRVLSSRMSTGSTQISQSVVWHVVVTGSKQTFETSSGFWNAPSGTLQTDLQTLPVAE